MSKYLIITLIIVLAILIAGPVNTFTGQLIAIGFTPSVLIKGAGGTLKRWNGPAWLPVN